ncbi:primase C-terminal domain-containing protein [Enterococcus faecium]|uniref:Primase C-terminal domain-containing protein n=1 Tax=Enterococcus faecium TaxID=1352 RepID=A0A9X3XU34_ENTFC|nr:primase C-terminal domain-containing protein [Enterococcus faecium]MDC4247615.1 primase C-terminal domain-containing protein [Enterococcus faecium]
MLNLFLKNGLRTYKFKNSRLKPVGFVEEEKKGSIFIYYSKEALSVSRGVVITSIEAVEEQADTITHWTPNVYRYGEYADTRRSVVKGHFEKNLRQINTFVVDIDSKENHEGEIILACIDYLGFMPTLILESDFGYQVYFVLSTPAYVTSKSNFKVIEVAKRISMAIRSQLAKQLPGIDVGCNHFGIARFPNTKNIVFCELENQYSFSDWLNWSMKIASNQKTEVERNAKLIVFPEKKEYRQVDEPWFDLLLRKADIIGGKGRLGRNNVILTLSLAYFSSGYGQETCTYNMFEFNERLKEPLAEKEVETIVKSAYSGNYQAARRDFILELCQEWVSSDIQENELFIQRRGWWKFKKPREQREYSHKHEWRVDLLDYLKQVEAEGLAYIESTRKELQEKIGIPARSLDRLLKELREERKIFYRSKRGKGGGIILMSIRTFLKQCLKRRREKQQVYLTQLKQLFLLTNEELEATIAPFLATYRRSKQLDLFEADTG